MAPEVQVPMNFGRHHLNSPTHCNLTLNLRSGKKSRANSLILSFNSPVIERLVTTQQVTSLDVEEFQEVSVECFVEFQEESVGCFVDCLYTGEVEMLDKHSFREVNKMARVFDVEWLKERCSWYFKDLVNGMSHNYEDMLYLFEEASYVLSDLKERGLINLVLPKIASDKDCNCVRHFPSTSF